MPDTDRKVLDQSSEIALGKVVARSWTVPFILQVAVISASFAMVLSGFAWWRTGSTKLIWPWLCGEQVMFEPTRIDFGQVSQNDVLERQIRVVNLSSKPLTLLGSQPSCGCISLEEFPIVVPVGKPHVLTLKIATPDKSGSFEHFIKFFSDESSRSSVVVKISGSVD